MRAAFIDRLMDRLEKLDPQSLQTQFLRLVRERGLLETIFQSIQEGVIVVDGAGSLTYANRAAENLLGFTFDAAQGRPVSRYLRGIDWDRVLRMDAGEWSTLINQELEIDYPERRVLSFYIVPIAVEQEPRGSGAVIILRNVTPDRDHEEALLESERLKAVKLLAAGVAHEIGNPLNALTIHLQLLRRHLRRLPEEHREEIRELVSVAADEVARLDLIITQFLRAIRPSKPKPAAADIEALLKETLRLLKLEIRNRRIEVAINRPGPVPRVRVDRNQIKQVFFNLIRNAFQAMPDRGALHITLAATDRHLMVVFRDTGHGIPPEDLGRIFEPYHTTKSGGSGLGLMIVERIVQDHGGHIEVASKPGEGASFTVYLPLTERRVRLLKPHRSAAGRDEPAGAAAGHEPAGDGGQGESA